MTVLAFAAVGAGAAACFWLVVAVVTFVLVLAGAARGVGLVRRQSRQSRRAGAALLAVCAVVPLACCVGPSLLFRLEHGRFPLGAIPGYEVREAMERDRLTTDEVIARFGLPHQRDKFDDGEDWLYATDALGMSDFFLVQFGPDGRVKHTGIVD